MPDPSQHHILIISLDALRADCLGCYGFPENITPNIDALAAQSVRFQNATSPATWTLPGHMSMLSGLEPTVHGCVSSHRQYPPATLPFPLVFELLREQGYATQAVVGGGFMEARFGFGRGVDLFELVSPILDALLHTRQFITEAPRTLSFLHTYMVHDYPRITTRDRPLRRVEQRDPDYQGFFPTDADFIHLLKALSESEDAPELSQRDVAYLRDLYLAAVRSTDAAFSVLFGMFDRHRLWENTTVVLTSDHGESLGDAHDGRQFWFHGGPAYHEQTRVPLLIRPAPHLWDLLEPGSVVEQPVSILDIVPTLLDLVERPYNLDQFDGLSLGDLCQGQIAAFETRKLHSHSCEDPENPFIPEVLFGSSMPWRETGKVIYNPRTLRPRQLFLAGDDPAEEQNQLHQVTGEELDRLERAIADYHAACSKRAHDPPAEPFEDNKLLARLAELGYIEA